MRRLPILVALSAAFVVALCGVAFADAEVTITDEGLQPQTVRADVRETIVWTNATDEDVSLEGKSPKWESGPIAPGATFSIQITKKGSYTYASTDGSLTGRIVVGQVNAGGGGGGDAGGDGDGKKKARKANNNQGDGQAKNTHEGIDPDQEALPRTGTNVALPGALSMLLIALGAGLLLVTQPPRRVRRLIS